MKAHVYTYGEAAWGAIFIALVGFALGIHFMLWMGEREAARKAAEPKLTPMKEARKGTDFMQWSCEPRQRAEYLEVCKQRLRSGVTRAVKE